MASQSFGEGGAIHELTLFAAEVDGVGDDVVAAATDDDDEDEDEDEDEDDEDDDANTTSAS